MTDAQLNSALGAILATPALARYSRLAVSINRIAVVAGLSRLTIYRCAAGDATITSKTREKIKNALLAIDSSVKKSHPRMSRHDPQDAAGVATGLSIAKSAV